MYYSNYDTLGGPGYFILLLFILACVGFYLYCYWRIFEKAGRKGWEALIPGHNTLEQFLMVGRPGWWYFLMLIPLVNIVIGIMLIFDLAKVFGKDTGFGFGLLLLSFVFVPILALGDAEYQGPLTFD